MDLADVPKLDALLEPSVKDEKDGGVKKEGTADVDDKEGIHLTHDPMRHYFTCSVDVAVEDEEEGFDKSADRLMNWWISWRAPWDDWLYPGKSRVETQPQYCVFDVAEKFDSLRYMREVVKSDFKSIYLMARQHLSKFDNSGFQERVFSIAGNAQKKNQSKMDFDLVERRTLLCTNKDYIEKGLIPMISHVSVDLEVKDECSTHGSVS